MGGCLDGDSSRCCPPAIRFGHGRSGHPAAGVCRPTPNEQRKLAGTRLLPGAAYGGEEPARKKPLTCRPAPRQPWSVSIPCCRAPTGKVSGVVLPVLPGPLFTSRTPGRPSWFSPATDPLKPGARLTSSDFPDGRAAAKPSCAKPLSKTGRDPLRNPRAAGGFPISAAQRLATLRADAPSGYTQTDSRLHGHAGRGYLLLSSGLPRSDAGECAAGAVRQQLKREAQLEARTAARHKLESASGCCGRPRARFQHILLTSSWANSRSRAWTPKWNLSPPARCATRRRRSLRARDLTQQLLTFAKGGAPIPRSGVRLTRFAKSLSLPCPVRTGAISDIPGDLWPAF